MDQFGKKKLRFITRHLYNFISVQYTMHNDEILGNKDSRNLAVSQMATPWLS